MKTNILSPRTWVTLLAGLLTVHAVQADYFWRGNGQPDGNWSNPANWSAPVAHNGQRLVFVGSKQRDTTNDIAWLGITNFVNFRFTNQNATLGGFTIRGDKIDKYWSTGASYAVTNGTIVDTIDLDLDLGGGNINFDCQSGHGLTINGVIGQVPGENPNYLARTGGDATNFLTLNGLNTFGCRVQISSGAIVANTIMSNGFPSSLGLGTSNNVPMPTQIGNSGSTGRLLYTGGDTATDRQIQIGGGTAATHSGGATLQNDGTGALVFVNPQFNVPQTTAINTTNRPLNLQGTNTGANEIRGTIADNNASPGGGKVRVVKSGSGNWMLSGANTYTGNTAVQQGTLALSGSATIANSVLITVTNGATFDVSGLSSTFTLGASQTLSNSAASTGNLAGNLDASAGTISVSFTAGTPAFVITNGALTLSAGTVFNVDNTGAQLASGTYPLITKATGGSVAGAEPSVTVGGSGAAAAATLQITGGELNLVIAASQPNPTNITYTVSGSELVLDWPAGQGWNLQAQTNNLNAGITTNWSTISGATPPFTNAIDPANPTVFYRLQY